MDEPEAPQAWVQPLQRLWREAASASCIEASRIGRHSGVPGAVIKAGHLAGSGMSVAYSTGQ